MKKQWVHSKKKLALRAAVAAVMLLTSVSSQALEQQANDQAFKITIMNFNIWNNGAGSKIWDVDAKDNGTLAYNQTMKDLLNGVGPDVLVFPELNNNVGKFFGGKDVAAEHVRNSIEMLNGLPDKMGNYHHLNGSEIIASKAGEFLNKNTILMKLGNGFPDVYIEGRHLNHYDEPDERIIQAKALNAAALPRVIPTIITGDLNAGELSERGLNRAEQQLRVLSHYIASPSNKPLWSKLAEQYIAQGQTDALNAFVSDMRSKGTNGREKFKDILDKYFKTHKSEFPGVGSIDTMSWDQWDKILFGHMKANGIASYIVDETYSVASNQPQTMNILKQQYQLLQLDRNREFFKPSIMGDGRATWTSDGEDGTNTWPGWDRVNIDHILISRPFAKWVEIVDNGTWSGTLSSPATLPGGGSLSDHEPIAQTLRWIGPKLDTYMDGDTEKSRMTWGADAAKFDTNNKEFYLTRNNNRNDIFLGQVSDENGIPILAGLTLEEKKTLLDCKGNDPRFAQAISDYCIDDHSFIGETMVSDGGTVIVDEDAALGNATASLHLNEGGLRIAGETMRSLNRQVMLDGNGWIDVADVRNNLTLVQMISGTGNLIKCGAGALTLNGVNDFTGDTTVEKGKLIVGDADHATASLFGSVTVGDQAFLSGIGTIGGLHVSKGGYVTPGNSIGTLTITGNMTLNAGAHYVVEINPDGESDKIAASGSANIVGAMVYIDKAAGSYVPGNRYTILTADAGVIGTFADLSQNMPFIRMGLDYDSNAVYLDIRRNDVTFLSVGESDNQRAVAASLEALGADSPLYASVVELESLAGARHAFNMLSGEIHASVKSALINTSTDLRNATQDRMRAAFGDTTAQSDVQVEANKDALAALWVQGFGTWTEKASNGNAAKLSQNSGGFFVGYDTQVGEYVWLGALVGYSRTNFKAEERASSGDSDNYHLGFYGGTQVGDTAFSGGIAYSWHRLDISRSVIFSSMNEKLTSDYNAATMQAFGEVCHKLHMGTTVFEPFANLAYMSLQTDDAQESGGKSPLALEGDTTNSTFTTLGVRAATNVALGNVKGKLNGTLGWQHGFGDIEPSARASFASGTGFDVSGMPVAKDSAIVQVGFDMKASERTMLGISYAGQFGSGSHRNSVKARLGVKF